MDIVLIPGLWLKAESWDPVTDRLQRAGHSVTALTLPGLESQRADRSRITLSDHLAAVVAAVDAAAGTDVAVVGHSASSTLAMCAADARPDRVRRVLYLGGFPEADGGTFMAGLPAEGDDVPFPGWAAFEGPDSADLDEATRQRLLEEFVPSPAGVLSDTVRYADERRHRVPATVVCPEFSPQDAKDWIAAGDVPELAATEQLDFVDIDSGHWPQFTRPAELATIIDAEARR